MTMIQIHMKTVLFLISVAVLVLHVNSSNEVKSRIRRKIAFTKNSNVFFRFNGKDNVLRMPAIFAHGWSIRINYPLPETVAKRYKFFKRAIRNEDIADEFPAKGYECMMKFLCQSIEKFEAVGACGFFCEIGDIIRRTRGVEANFFQSIMDQCGQQSHSCPYFLNDDFPDG